MLEIQRTTLSKAMKLLNSIGAEYAIVVGEETHGTLPVAKKPKPASKNSVSHKYGRNVVLNYVKPYIDTLKVGDVAQIPVGDFDLASIAATAASHAHRVFGAGGHTGRTDREKNVFELMRLEA